MPILIFLGLSVLELRTPDVRDRQTDRLQTDRRQTKSSLNASPHGGGGITIYTVDFYRSTLCVSAVFVRLSVTLVDGIHMAEDIVKFLSRPSSPVNVILVF